MSEQDGGPAFPVIAENGVGHIADGMTLRDWFAGQIASGMVAGIEANGGAAKQDGWDQAKKRGATLAEMLARESYGIADALIKERGKVGSV